MCDLIIDQSLNHSVPHPDTRGQMTEDVIGQLYAIFLSVPGDVAKEVVEYVPGIALYTNSTFLPYIFRLYCYVCE